ncbi:MAG: peptidoglycan-binding protein [Phormidesmis sp.]
MQAISASNVSLDTVSGAAHIQVRKIKKPTLRSGSSHPDVAELQTLLQRYASPAVSSGTFDSQTDYAVRLFQYRMFLTEDGVVGDRTWLALYTGAPVSMEILRQGSQGQLVRTVQKTLLASGYVMAVDGDFGAVTHSSVIAFQQCMGLKVDGIVGLSTWHALSKIRLEDPVTPIQRFVLHHDEKRHTAAITDIAVAPYGQNRGTVATASLDTTVRFWLFNGLPYDLVYAGDCGAVSSVVFYPKKNQIISGTFGGTIRIAHFSLKTGPIETTHIFPARGGSVEDLDVDPDGKYIAAVTGENAGRLFNFKGELLRELFNSSTQYGSAKTVSISPRGDRLATGSRNGGASLWNTPLNANAYGLNLSSSRSANVVAFSPHGYKIAVARDNLLTIYADQQQALTNFRFESSIAAMAFNPTGRYLALGCYDHKIYIFDLQENGGQGKVVFVLEAHESPVSAVVFSTLSARFFYSGDTSGRLITWEMRRFDPDAQVQMMGEDPAASQPSPF